MEAKQKAIKDHYGEEKWFPIVGYENLYLISTKGNIRSIKRRHNLSLCNNRGYRQIKLCKDGKHKTFQVHKLMSYNFFKDDCHNPKLVVDHINGIKSDNRIENLQMITHRENIVKSKTNTHIGATYMKKSKKWISRIRHNKKYIHLGMFSTPEEASSAYKSKLIELTKPNLPLY